MKLLRKLLAALLLVLILIACDQRVKRSEAVNKPADKSQVQEMRVSELKMEPQKQSNQNTTVDYESVRVVRDNDADGMVDPVDLEKSVIEERKETFNTEDYDNIVENKFLTATQNPLSTFSIDVDEASYSNVRRYLENGSLPPAGAVRIEEMINYFDYTYQKPTNGEPFTVNTEISSCPWNTKHRLVHIGLQGNEIPIDNLPASNMVFLIDVSGSMNEPNKLPLVQASLNMLVDQLREKDKVAIVVYAGSAGLVLPSTNGEQRPFNKSDGPDGDSAGRFQILCWHGRQIL